MCLPKTFSLETNAGCSQWLCHIQQRWKHLHYTKRRLLTQESSFVDKEKWKENERKNNCKFVTLLFYAFMIRQSYASEYLLLYVASVAVIA